MRRNSVLCEILTGLVQLNCRHRIMAVRNLKEKKSEDVKRVVKSWMEAKVVLLDLASAFGENASTVDKQELYLLARTVRSCCTRAFITAVTAGRSHSAFK